MAETHTDRSFEQELKSVHSLVCIMGEAVSAMLTRTLRALETGDTVLAHQVISADRDVNRMEVELDELCMKVIARRQPVASDLRFLAMTLKLDTDLERMGDLCVDACERILELSMPVNPDAGALLQEMGARVQDRVETALRAFLGADVTLAERVIESDAAVNDGYHRLFGTLLAGMRAGARPSPMSVRLLAIGRCFERIADHAANIAEMAIFYAQGRDVRHPRSPVVLTTSTLVGP